MVKLSPVRSARTRDTTTFGDVPTCVISPPISDPNAIGIKNTEGCTFERRANWNATGIMIASAPMFFMKAERMVTVTTRRASCALTDCSSGRKRWMAASTTPERATPALTMSALPTMMTISSLNPSKA